MQFKRYTIASLIFMAAVGTFVHLAITKEMIAFDFMGIQFPNLPIAVWVVVPVAFLYLASVLHMMFYAVDGYFKLKRLDRDNEKMVDALRDALLGVADRNYVYKSEAYKLMGKIVDNSVLFPFETLRAVGNDKIDDALELMRNVKEKKRVDIKKFHLAKNTSIVIQDNLNRLERGELDAENILSRKESYGDVVAAKAFEAYVKRASVSAIMKFKNYFTKSSLLDFVSRINADENGIEITNEELIGLLKGLKLEIADYVDLSVAMSKNMLPDQRIRLFESISEQCEDAMEGYLYTLYDLQMNDTANEILNNTAHNDYLIFKAYRDLKKVNRNYDIAIFLRRNCS